MIGTVVIERKRGVYVDPCMTVRVGHRRGLVHLRLDDALVEFETPVAVRAGLALVRQAAQLEVGEFMVLRVNGKEIHLLPEIATNLGGAMLRKADAADDWQLQSRRIH